MRTRNIVLLIIIVILVLFGTLFLSDKISDSGLIEPVNDSIVEEVSVVCGNDDDCPSNYGCKNEKCYELYCTTCGNDCVVWHKGIPEPFSCVAPTENLGCKVVSRECVKTTHACGNGVCGLCEVGIKGGMSLSILCPEDCGDSIPVCGDGICEYTEKDDCGFGCNSPTEGCGINPYYCPEDCEDKEWNSRNLG